MPLIDVARTHAPVTDFATATGLAAPSPTPALNASALAERMARKAAKLQRRHTLGEVIRVYLASNDALLKRDPGRKAPLRMWDEVLGDRLMDEVSADEVAEVLAMYAEQPVRRFAGKDPATGEPIYRDHGQRSASTVNRAKVVLSAVFTYAKENALLGRGVPSPTREIKGKGFKAAQMPDRAIKPEQLDALLAHARTAPWRKMYLFVLMAVTTGARRGELLQLRGANLKLDDENPHALVGLEQTEEAHTKNGEAKVLNLSPRVVQEIRRWGVPDAEELLFPSERKPGQPFNIASSYRALVRKVGIIENQRLHDLRHTAGTTFANEGRSAQEIQALLGHKTLAMVPRYTRVQPHAKARAFNESALSKLK